MQMRPATMQLESGYRTLFFMAHLPLLAFDWLALLRNQLQHDLVNRVRVSEPRTLGFS